MNQGSERATIVAHVRGCSATAKKNAAADPAQVTTVATRSENMAEINDWANLRNFAVDCDERDALGVIVNAFIASLM